MANSFTRRQALAGLLGTSALALTMPSLLAGCAPVASDPKKAATQGLKALPDYIPYGGLKYDLPGTPGRVTDGSITFPKNAPRMFSDTPGDGKPFRVWTLVNENPPAKDVNPFWTALDKRLGSEYSPTLTLSADYATKFPTLLASGDMPDLFAIPGQYSGVGKLLAKTGADLTPYLAGSAVKDYPALANIPTESWRGCVFDGKLRAVPIPRGLTSTWIMYGRRDLLEAKGLPLSASSFDEFRSMCQELTEPSRNVWALAANPLDYLRSMLSIPRYFVQEKGTFSSAYAHESQKDALEAARKLNADGFINPDAIGATTPQSKQWVVSGQGCFTWDTYSAWLGFYFDLKMEPGNLVGQQVPAFEGEGSGKAQLGDPNNIIAGISGADPKRVETILKLADFFAAPFGTDEYLFRKFGVEGEQFTMVDGSPTPVEARKRETYLGQQYLVDGPAHLFYSNLGDQVKAIQAHQKALTENAATDPAYGYYSPTRSEKGGGLDSTMLSLALDIVAGRKAVSDWDAGVSDYLANGGKAICEELTAAYEAVNS
jgi:putative aldouronate transport system substrate-binding protein